MENYLGLLIDRTGVIRDVHRIDCVQEIDAVEFLRHVLAAADGFESGEIWRGRQRIAKIISSREAHEPSASAGTSRSRLLPRPTPGAARAAPPYEGV